MVGGWWLVVGGWWLVAGGWWLVVGTSIRGPKMEVLAAIIALSTDCEGFISSCKMVTIGDCMGLTVQINILRFYRLFRIELVSNNRYCTHN